VDVGASLRPRTGQLCWAGCTRSGIRGDIILPLRSGQRGSLKGSRMVQPLMHRNGNFQRAGKHGQLPLGRDDVRCPSTH
jgi:hypothetical protein